jgi:excisionase family DNA binding protein
MAITVDGTDAVSRLAGEIERLRIAIKRDTPHGLLSFRKAAKLLGIDRGRTLHDMIAAGQIRTVHVGSREKIPVSEIQRLLVDETAWRLKV